MIDISAELDTLYELSELRDRAKELRKLGRTALKAISPPLEEVIDLTKIATDKTGKEWVGSKNEVEYALLARLQNHRDMDDELAEAAPRLMEELQNIGWASLFPRDEIDSLHAPVPVLLAARAMHALVGRADTVFSKATMLCYYRIVRELYTAGGPDWIIGAARAGKGGSASAFITGECIRAILAFENAITRTIAFFLQTKDFHERFQLIKSMPASFADWKEIAIERAGLDWFIQANPGHRDLALSLPPLQAVDENTIEKYFRKLPAALKKEVRSGVRSIQRALDDIQRFREREEPSASAAQHSLADPQRRHNYQTESAHERARSVIENASQESKLAAGICKDCTYDSTLSN